MQVYFSDKWNYFDITILCFFTIGVILDLVGYYETVEVGRVFLAISLIAFFMRILKAFSALEELGPKVWMIASMVKTKLFRFKKSWFFMGYKSGNKEGLGHLHIMTYCQTNDKNNCYFIYLLNTFSFTIFYI